MPDLRLVKEFEKELHNEIHKILLKFIDEGKIIPGERRGRGRPAKVKTDDEPKEKKPRGRPKKTETPKKTPKKQNKPENPEKPDTRTPAEKKLDEQFKNITIKKERVFTKKSKKS